MNSSSLKRMWATWRSKYINAINTPSECIFCEKINAQTDIDNLVLYRGRHLFVILNLYPYNSGHLMIIPYRHIGDIEQLNDDESIEMMRLLKYFVSILKKTMHPNGFNSGFNLGRSAGAGIEDHIHLHLVPRWAGDTNFMPVLDNTKVISEDIHLTYKKIKTAIIDEEIKKC